jgi:hypothetical protein
MNIEKSSALDEHGLSVFCIGWECSPLLPALVNPPPGDLFVGKLVA